MSEILHPLGSSLWLEQVFASPPAITLRGRTKHTQYHHRYIEALGRYVGAQGARESAALTVLEYLYKLGHITRFKEQPFRTTENEFGVEIVPDFLAVSAAYNEPFVIEVKNTRFLDRFTQSKLASNRMRFVPCHLNYIVWTDQRPLNKALRTNISQMRHYGELVSLLERNALSAFVIDCGSISVEAALKKDFDLSDIYAAAWHGEIHFEITSPMNFKTKLSPLPVQNLPAIFLNSKHGEDDWWANLDRS